MCRWLAYVGDPINVGAVLYEPQNSLIHQSLDSRLGAEPTNGDGFGLGWYHEGSATPLQYRTVEPAWNDHNLFEVTRELDSACFFAHVRAAIGSPVQQTNCHPFRYGRWLFMHNGYVDGWPRVHRNLATQIEPDLFHEITGCTDSEVLFYLALTFGLAEDPIGALERMVGAVEAECERVSAREGIQMTVAVTDGSTLYSARHATRGVPRSLYQSNDIATVRQLYPDNERLALVPDDARFVVSEPLNDLPQTFSEIPPDTAVIMSADGVETRPFSPSRP
jgi:glutamine amidotransferase